MAISGVQIGIGSYYSNSTVCPSKDGCPPDICPDIVLKRHDTKPPFKVAVDTCDGAMDLTDELLVAEISIWAKAKLKHAIDADDTYFQLADNIGFEQILPGDIIVMDRVRNPEQMLVTGFDETNHLVQVTRAYGATIASTWKKGTVMRIFRAMNSSASIESIIGDVIQEDGSTLADQLLETYLVYEWQPKDTCTPGCYWIEFKLLKMEAEEEDVDSLAIDDSIDVDDISFTSSNLSYTDFGCYLGEGVEWVRRFPATGEGFLVKIVNTQTSE